jgi:hypothetical protein
VTDDPLAQLAAAAHTVADGLEELAPRLNVVGDFVLQEASRQRRAGFLHCPGCAECAEPLPLLAGDV